MKVDCDEDQPLNCPCAIIKVMYDYSTPDWGLQVGLEGRKMVYLPAPGGRSGAVGSNTAKRHCQSGFESRLSRSGPGFGVEAPPPHEQWFQWKICRGPLDTMGSQILDSLQ